MKNILVVGSINMDLTVSTPKIPVMGETIHGHSFVTSPGGKGANQAIAAAKSGGTVKFFGAVGNDVYANVLVNNLEYNGVEFKGESIEDISTGVAVITIFKGNNSIILDAGANGRITVEMLERNKELFTWADYLILQGEIPEEINIESAKYAKETGTVVVFNPAPYQDFSDELYKYIDWIIPNESETELMTGVCVDDEDSARKAVNLIRKKGVRNVIITWGENGSVYSCGEDIKIMPARKTEAIDTTAAGDCFIGNFVRMLAEDSDIDAAVQYATIASSIAVSRRGASDSLPTKNEIDKLMYY